MGANPRSVFIGPGHTASHSSIKKSRRSAIPPGNEGEKTMPKKISVNQRAALFIRQLLAFRARAGQMLRKWQRQRSGFGMFALIGRKRDQQPCRTDPAPAMVRSPELVYRRVHRPQKQRTILKSAGRRPRPATKEKGNVNQGEVPNSI